jgi:diguanylate cyclase (GGDEF)-like protein/PAS domain S-box-containing protein
VGLDGNQYRIIVESAPNMLWRSGKDAACDYFNNTWLSYTGRTLEQELGNGWVEGVHPEDYDRCVRTYLEAFRKREIFEMIYRLRRYDGEWRWIHDRGVPFCDDNGEFNGYIGSCIDVNEQVTGESWKTMAQKDGLTGIFNRQYFESEARKAFSNALLNKRDLCVAMIDIDNFKHFNDSYGHAYGDKILISLAGILKDSIRDSDLLGRYGGDEFILLLHETSLYGAQMIISRIADRWTPPLNKDEDINIPLSFSFGIAEAKDSETFESLIQQADRLMYEDKKRKKQ